MAGTATVHLADQLAAGFAALSGEYQVLFEQQQQLESKLAWAKQQYLDLLKRFTPDTLPQDHIAFLQNLDRVASEQPCSQYDWIEKLSESEDSQQRNRGFLIKQAVSASSTLRASPMEVNLDLQAGVKIWSGPSADRGHTTLRIQSDIDRSHMEMDFTTPGTPSKLGCPFANGSTKQSPLATPLSSPSRASLKGRRSKRPSFTDPIRAEICGNDPVSTSASVEGSAAVCPIRFLDQHAPEEVAKYFEKHKHELPRSHEVCISRFQSNAESIRQLDRKYGNLVSMIQGLGEKHQAWLPEEPEEDEAEAVEDEAKADAKVQNWAKAVTASLHGCTHGEDEVQEQAPDEARTAHFDRPLKEIRVGESPSRPWGISIPAKYINAESSSSVGSAPTASPPLPLETDRPIGETPRKAGQCPFDVRVKADGSKVRERVETALPGPAGSPDNVATDAPPQPTAHPVETKAPECEHEAPKVVPQIVFNGPVFLGYPPDQLMSMLQSSNLGATTQ